MNSTPDSDSWPLCYIGSVLFFVAACIGAAFCVPGLQQALSMRAQPDSITLQDFIANGPKNNAHVRLTDLTGNVNSSFQIMTTSRRKFHTSTRLSKVYINLVPAGQEPTASNCKVALRASEKSPIWSQLENGYVTGRLIPAKLGNNAINDTGRNNRFLDNGVRWLIEPVETIPSKASAYYHFILALIFGALGLVIACLGHATKQAVAVIISMVGAPLRAPSVSMHWRMMYFGCGVAALTFGYSACFGYGQMGQVTYVELIQVAGFFLMQIGLAGAVAPFAVPEIVRFFGFSDVKTTTPKIDSNRAEKATPGSSSIHQLLPSKMEIDQYEDLGISPAENSKADSTQFAIDRAIVKEMQVQLQGVYTAIDFSKSTSSKFDLLVHSSCKGLIFVDQTNHDGVPRFRLATILGDGMAVVTASQSTDLPPLKKQGSTCNLLVVESQNLLELFQLQLERVVSLSQQRSTKQEMLPEEEALNVVLYARRAVAEMQFQYGLSEREVSPRTYGPLDYPNGVSKKLQTTQKVDSGSAQAKKSLARS